MVWRHGVAGDVGDLDRLLDRSAARERDRAVPLLRPALPRAVGGIAASKQSRPPGTRARWRSASVVAHSASDRKNGRRDSSSPPVVRVVGQDRRRALDPRDARRARLGARGLERRGGGSTPVTVCPRSARPSASRPCRTRGRAPAGPRPLRPPRPRRSRRRVTRGRWRRTPRPGGDPRLLVAHRRTVGSPPMALTIGIAGLPNVGKSTLFNALTQAEALAANYPFATIEPNVGVVPLPDPRLDVLAGIFDEQADRPRHGLVRRHRRHRQGRERGRRARQQVPRQHPRGRRDLPGRARLRRRRRDPRRPARSTRPTTSR